MNIGLDEVGRGALSGPVVCGCAAFVSDINSKLKVVKASGYLKFIVKGDDILICDSKKMTPYAREIANLWIREKASSFGIGVGSVSKINKKGIVKSANFAFRSSFHACKIENLENIKEVLIDAFFIPRLGKIKKQKQTPIIHGDSLKFEIAAASIIAKVYRDNLMKKLSLSFPNYRWEQNKGYGTKSHIDAIKKYGLSGHHRFKFCQNFVSHS